MTLWARVILSGRKIMQLKAVVSIIVSLMFALTIPNVGMSQSENGQSHAAVLIPESTIEQYDFVTGVGSDQGTNGK
jgi:hypothetical protein